MKKRALCVAGKTVTAMVLAVCLTASGARTVQGRIADYRVTEDYSPPPAAQPELPWYIHRVGADTAWGSTAAGQNIIVAVLDTGIDAKHEDLAGKVVAAVNFSSSPTTDDINGHGTLTAGIIAAYTEKLKGATGIAYESRLMNVKVAADNGFVNPGDVVKGIIWAADNGASVINLSLTLSKPSAAIDDAVQYAWSKGVVVVAAAGNSASRKPVYPAASPNVIGVAATDADDCLAKWSNKGDWVSVSAPGVDIYSTLPQDRYGTRSGTSYATALVSGEAALLCAVAADKSGNGLVNDEVRNAILRETEQRADGAGMGRIDVARAVKLIMGR
jgi:thermitase